MLSRPSIAATTPGGALLPRARRVFKHWLRDAAARFLPTPLRFRLGHSLRPLAPHALSNVLGTWKCGRRAKHLKQREPVVLKKLPLLYEVPYFSRQRKTFFSSVETSNSTHRERAGQITEIPLVASTQNPCRNTSHCYVNQGLTSPLREMSLTSSVISNRYFQYSCTLPLIPAPLRHRSHPANQPMGNSKRTASNISAKHAVASLFATVSLP